MGVDDDSSVSTEPRAEIPPNSRLPTMKASQQPGEGSDIDLSPSVSDNFAVAAGANDGISSELPRNMPTARELQMESDLRELKATLSELMEKRPSSEAYVQEFKESYMTDEHQFTLQQQRYGIDSSSDSSDDDYAQFEQQRRRMERVYIRELKTLNREKEMVKNIRSLKRDQKTLLEKERAWEKERVELEKLRRQFEKDKQESGKDGMTGRENSSEEDANQGRRPGSPDLIGELSEEIEFVPTRPSTQAVPKLHYVEWSTFKAVQLNTEDESFAIMVLKGEPTIAYDYKGFHWRSRKSKHRRGEGDETLKNKMPIKKKQPLSPGQAPLPERIRIHSRNIIKILEKICDDTLTTHLNEPVVMIRPYKFLVYYEDQIRQKFHSLRAKFGNPETATEAVTDVAAFTEGTESVQTPVDKDTEPTSPGSLGNIEPQPATPVLDIASKQEDGAEDEDDEGDNEVTTSAIAFQQLGCLIEFMDTEIEQKLKYLASGRCERVSFPDVWYLFKPGEEIIDQSRKQVYRVLEVTSVAHKVIPPWRNYFDKSSAKSEETPVSISCVYVDFDGKELGPVNEKFEIARFDGEVAVTSLEVYPLRFADSGTGALRKSFIDRGRNFLDVAAIKHMHYSGLTLDARDEVDSQVVVDFEEAFASRAGAAGDWMPRVEQLIGVSLLEKADDELCSAECCRDETVVSKDNDVETKRSQDYIASLIPDDRGREPSVTVHPRSLKAIMSPGNSLTEDELLITSYRVFAFVLRSRKWAQLDLTYLSHISSSKKNDSLTKAEEKNDEKTSLEKKETAFDQLVLPQGHKEMVQSLIAQHYRDKESTTADTEQVDIVRGKGKGLIILLHGAPGVGKTTTAEGVAELFQKPLFQITCGDLGTTASEVELALETNFALANRWGCILLLDEADVFLTARSPQDFIRNGLVAVFLRVLEYYAGILFLTTNRIGDFDEAFASRVHISLHYPQLDLNSTLAIFKLNLRLVRERFEKKGREITIDEDAILEFASTYWADHEKMRWNGRQIRNGCQTALALAEFDAQGGSHERIKDAHAEVKLHVSHLETVSGAYLDFIRYLKKVYGQDSDRRARAIGIRARESDARKEESLEPRATPTGKRTSDVYQAETSSLGVATPQPEQPSPGPTPAHLQQFPPSTAPPGHYPYPFPYQPQQFAQPPNPPSGVPPLGSYPMQATADQGTGTASASPGQVPWQSLGLNQWQIGQQTTPGNPHYSGFVPGVWPSGTVPPQQGVPSDPQRRS